MNISAVGVMRCTVGAPGREPCPRCGGRSGRIPHRPVTLRSSICDKLCTVGERESVSWLLRSAAFGATPDEFGAAFERGARSELGRLLDPAGAGIRSVPDPWDDAQLPFDPSVREARLHAIDTWLTLMATTPRPLVDRMAWFWHGHFVSALDKVRVARLMVNQVRLFRVLALGNFVTLLRAVTVDPAMLVYLDGRTSTGESANENYAREVMELFTLGVGNYDEPDVQAAATALTGWTVTPEGAAQYRPKRHDDTPQVYLGNPKVHNVDTVVDTLAAQPELARFIVSAVCRALLGIAPEGLVTELAVAFAADFELAPLVQSVLEAGLDGTREPIVLEPARWLAIAQRATGAELKPRQRLMWLRSAGQVPMVPPNVAGWPSGPAWFSASAVVARANLAAALAGATERGHPVLVAAEDGSDQLAERLGLPDSFGPTTTSVLKSATPRDRLALALCSPEYLLV